MDAEQTKQILRRALLGDAAPPEAPSVAAALEAWRREHAAAWLAEIRAVIPSSVIAQLLRDWADARWPWGTCWWVERPPIIVKYPEFPFS